GDAYSDNVERFAFLSRGALEASKALGFFPDVIHANDWQTALVPFYVDTVEWGKPLHHAATVYTIHNLAYQGVTDGGAMFITGLGQEHYNADELEHFGALNLTKGALKRSTVISTVSPAYAREVQTPELGCGLDGILRARSGDLFGILNGIDVSSWDPATDRHLPANFHHGDMTGKRACKKALQEEAGLARAKVPVFAAIGRLTAQKGFDVLASCMDRVLDWNVQLVLLGTGDAEAQRQFAELSARHAGKFRAWIGFDDGLAHRIEAGADFFVMPSRFEPCGLNQMYSLRYGTLPIVRGTGGLRDTVQSYREDTGDGTGFVFDDLSPDALANTMGWALSTYYQRKPHVRAMRERAMTQDFSWAAAASEYERLYEGAARRRRGR
ncbi:MAG TPA: glycogen synthase, partial [Polyangiaceae bacterium]|nr:glycogen synthase [Polyangiaceae bacterium]